MSFADLVVGTWVKPDRFELLDRLGASAQGEVYRARSLDTRATVAVKVFAPDNPHGAAHKAMVRRGHFARLLPSDHVVEYVESFSGPEPHEPGVMDTASEWDYLVCAWVPGTTLTAFSRVQHGDLRPLATAARGLSVLHSSANLIHGDIKPANILVDVQVTPVGRVVDLGSVRVIGSDFPSGGSATPRFTSPRVFEEPAHPRHDAYSLAFTGLHCLGLADALAEDAVPWRDLAGQIGEEATSCLRGAVEHAVPEGTSIAEWFAPLSDVDGRRPAGRRVDVASTSPAAARPQPEGDRDNGVPNPTNGEGGGEPQDWYVGPTVRMYEDPPPSLELTGGRRWAFVFLTWFCLDLNFWWALGVAPLLGFSVGITLAVVLG